MLSLAPALADPPVVFIADEPTLGLAPLAAEAVMRRDRELRDLGSAVLLVEEHAQNALDVADTLAFMELGNIVWTGPRAEADMELLSTAYLGRGQPNEAHRDVREARSGVQTTCPGDPNQRGECSVQTQNDMGGPLRRGRDRRGDHGSRAAAPAR